MVGERVFRYKFGVLTLSAVGARVPLLTEAGVLVAASAVHTPDVAALHCGGERGVGGEH